MAACLARETQSLVEDAEAGLPTTTRAAFCLRARQGLAFQDVGRALSLTPATALARLPGATPAPATTRPTHVPGLLNRLMEKRVMMNCSTLFAIEMMAIDRMSRAELITAIRAGLENLPADLRHGLDLAEESMDHLRLLLIAARLLHALRLRVGRPRTAETAGP